MTIGTETKIRRPDPLSPQQLQALELLLQGSTVTAAARALGVHRATVHEWARLPQFAAARLRHHDDVLDRLHSLADSSLSQLDQILSSETASESARLRAALTVLRSVERSAERQKPEPAPSLLQQLLNRQPRSKSASR